MTSPIFSIEIRASPGLQTVLVRLADALENHIKQDSFNIESEDSMVPTDEPVDIPLDLIEVPAKHYMRRSGAV